MLAGRCLPSPIERPSPYYQVPVATFFNIPRRYVRSNMQLGDGPADSPTEESKPSSTRNLRKSNRINDARASATSHPQQSREGIPSPHSTSPQPSQKKRPATLPEETNGEQTSKQSISQELPSPTSATSLNSGELSPQVCLCQPEPKIPRPRNAFILYRQHRQQEIIRENPGLNNPDISKIIGEQWKAENEEVKKEWQDLAQKEKARHQEQYPDYRYQPRRTGKSASSPLNPSGQHTTFDKYRCPKCGGRSIRTLTSPFLDSSGTPTLPPTLPPPNYTEGSTSTTRYLPVMNELSLQSPVRRRAHGPSGLSNIQVPSYREDHLMQSPGTPNYKKRRFEQGPGPSSAVQRRPDGPYYSQYARRESAPASRITPPHSATMPPIRTIHDRSRPSVIDTGATPTQAHPDQSPRSVEEVLRDFPYKNKIKLLGRISLSYQEPAPIRGAIIAVEGDDPAAVRELSEWLQDRLAKDPDYSYYPRILDPPKAPGDMSSFSDYLKLMLKWHDKSKEMIKYITWHYDYSSKETPSPSASNAIAIKPTERKDSASDSTPPPPSSSSPPTTLSRQPTSSSATSPTTTNIKPVIILPTFQLSASIAYASRIPIEDAYSMTDHWQWVATLWRGTVGPDLTIYVKTPEKDELVAKPQMDDQVRCLTIWKEARRGFGDADLRRVGFEVGEFIGGLGGR